MILVPFKSAHAFVALGPRVFVEGGQSDKIWSLRNKINAYLPVESVNGKKSEETRD